MHIEMYEVDFSPDSSGVEHLHGKQVVVGSIPILGISTHRNGCSYSYRLHV